MAPRSANIRCFAPRLVWPDRPWWARTSSWPDRSGVAGHCNIGDGVIVTAQSGTHGDIPAGAMVSGSPAFDHKQWLRAVGIFTKLPELAKTVRSLRLASNRTRIQRKNEP